MTSESGERRDRRARQPAGDKIGASRLLEENLQLRANVQTLTERVAEVERIADSDPLTPLPNRRFFERELERTVARIARYGTSAALLFVDLDGLKTINDFHGHVAGDMALIHVATLLKERIRASDVAARIGGDEFGLIIDNIDEAAARDKAASLAADIAAIPLGNGMRLSVSIGVTALIPTDAREAALGRADGDMYRAKRSR